MAQSNTEIDIPGLITIIVFIVMGVFMVLMVGSEEVYCNRQEDMCYIKRIDFLKKSSPKIKKIRLSDIQFVMTHVSSKTDSKKHGKQDTQEKPFYQTMLHTKNGVIQLFDMQSTIKFRHDRQANKFNSYLKSSTNELKLKDSRIIIYGCLFIFYSLAIIFVRPIKFKTKKHKTGELTLPQKTLKEIKKADNFNKFFSHTPPSGSFKNSTDSNKPIFDKPLSDSPRQQAGENGGVERL